ncbi:MAG: phage holin family protein [Anaerococcus hydrogenalis]|uniref:phage holin family protein n=1 Tax=Anaerococcus TaxID=165779 RepID=UPI0002E7F212|nr:MULTISPECIES: phage holin family protein [Anaerococcus]MDU1316687.1 phage holin family protein [Anaerococcus hydrogenalis]MDU3152973.1 phage holin family protein [Anaerococcus hydrogenalis]MDU3688141.1 phage holin family protein [Anaerococcus hydrogenalis]
MTFLVQWIADALSLYILDILFEGITFSQNKDIIITALLLMLVNAIIKPILKLLSLPLTIITFGLFSFIVNAIVLEITFNLASGASINSFGTALIASIILAIINPAISNFFDKK